MLRGLADVNYKFIRGEVGFEKESDDDTFDNSLLCKQMKKNMVNIPPDCNLLNSTVKAPLVYIWYSLQINPTLQAL